MLDENSMEALSRHFLQLMLHYKHVFLSQFNQHHTKKTTDTTMKTPTKLSLSMWSWC